jgi:hypothetical protein
MKGAFGRICVENREEWIKMVFRHVKIQGEALLAKVVLHLIERADALAFDTAGRSRAVRMVMMAMTTSSSIRVKPFAGRLRDMGRLLSD